MLCPSPAASANAHVAPTEATYNTDMGVFVLPYEVVRTSERPDEALMSFLETTYAAAAELGGWDRELLEQRPACACDLPGGTPMKSDRTGGHGHH